MSASWAPKDLVRTPMLMLVANNWLADKRRAGNWALKELKQMAGLCPTFS